MKDDEITEPALAMSQEQDVHRRREKATRLREEGMRRRRSLEKRGHFVQPAESPLGAAQLDALNSAIDDPDDDVRRLAIKTAGDLGDHSSVDALITRLDDDDPAVRIAAIISLGDIGGLRSAHALAGLVRSEDESREIRLAALTELEELAAKNITSGPDRRFDPPEAAKRHQGDDSPKVRKVKGTIIESLSSVETKEEESLLQLKARDVRTYLESGIED